VTIDPEALRRRLAAALGEELQLGELLGIGASGAVFRARDPRLERDVAVKVLDPALGITSDLEAEFLREARIVSSVEHPHIVPIYAAEARNGLLYLVMRLLPGRTLRDRLAEGGALAPTEAARLAHEIAKALELAHARGVVHRDIKPDNVLMDSVGNAIVTDFGVSVVTGRADAPDALGATVGTPSYMSPEQALGEAVDGRSDVYALGIMLFEMLTGRVPFEGRSVRELIAKHVAAPPPDVSAIRPSTPAGLAALVSRMLAKAPAERPDSAELVRLLTAARTPDALLSPADVRRRRRRKRLTYLGIAAAAAVLVLGVGGTLVIRAVVGISRAMNSGPPPALDAFGTAIPDSIADAFRGSGGLAPGERPAYAFIPAGAGTDAALLLTDVAIIHKAGGEPRRLPIADADFALNFRKPGKGPDTVGTLIVSVPGAAPDTIYTRLGGIEFSRLRTSLATVMRARENADPAP
jgi:serine/threonine-protein kinase